eukprot:scaffold6867_cov75-Cylindrotheca_fusiformis.AAC.1
MRQRPEEATKEEKGSGGEGSRLKQPRREQDQRDLSNQCVDSSWRQECEDHEYDDESAHGNNAHEEIVQDIASFIVAGGERDSRFQNVYNPPKHSTKC